jgi:uncharacterized repeat protein (TIGR01451 family)
MLEELLSVLPYNPSLINQLGFYGKRLRAERNIRRIGLIFIVLAFLVQFFAVLSPAQPTVADSTNDLVNGGFSSAAEAGSICNQNLDGYGTILANYGITCARVAAAPTIYIHSTDFNRQLYSMGRLPYGIAGEAPVNVDGTTYYIRYLWGWDTGPPSTYEALNVTTAGGQTFLLLYACGNLTSVGVPVPVAKPPALTISKTTSPGYPVANSTVAPGTILSYRVVFNDPGGVAQNVEVNDPVPANTTFNWIGSGSASTYGYVPDANEAQWKWPTVAGGTTNDYVDVKVEVNPNSPNGTVICNIANVSATGITPINSNQVCMTVKKACPPPVVTPPVVIPPPKVCQYDTSLPATSSLCVPCEYNSAITASNSLCVPCSASQSSQDTIACVVVHKTATNLTQGIADANNTTAQPSDNILYTLYADNEGKGAVSKYVFQEQLSDVLDYSNVVNLYGGTMGANDEVTWPAVNIAAGQTAFEQVEVQVMSVIPQTPTSSSDPDHFNLVMTNVYGNTININVPGSPAKAVETTAAALPNTGPGSSLFVGAIIVMVTGYFFTRSRLLAKETDIAMHDTINGGL